MSDKKQLTKTVKWLLENEPETRDNDRLLTIKVWQYQVNNMGGSMAWLASLYLEGKLPSEGTLTRFRRALQEKHPELRGKEWDKRHGKQQEVINDLNNLKNSAA